MQHHTLRSRRRRWDRYLPAWAHQLRARINLPTPGPSPINAWNGQHASTDSHTPLAPGQLVTLESVNFAAGHSRYLAQTRCLICETEIGHARCKIISLSVVPDAMPNTWGLPTRAYLVHSACDTGDDVMVHWAAHLRECPGCPCMSLVKAAQERALTADAEQYIA
jgi:hypothetical protein